MLTQPGADGPSLLRLRALLEELIAIASATKGKEDFAIDLRPVGEEFDPMQS